MLRSPACYSTTRGPAALAAASGQPRSKRSSKVPGSRKARDQQQHSVAGAPRKHAELYAAVDAADHADSNGSIHAAANAAAATRPAAARPAAARPAIYISPAKKPEILAPAGGWPQLRAAVENGADAVYLGLSDFNARARAVNFVPDELPEVMEYLHGRGVRGYVVLNILVYDDEMQQMQERIRQVAAAGVDAVIVQDLGVVELIRRIAPNLHIHGSTQMTITSPEGAEFARQLGVSRVVVGRELSVREISKVSAGSAAAVEAFVHGALCVSYSGQCFSSEAWGGRSANRGQCAQACRLPYGLLVDGVLRELGDVQYLLSPQDLAAVSLVPELIQAGVGCFKIEGRLKGPEYVAATVQVYRRAVDAAWAALVESSTSEEASGAQADGQQSAAQAADAGRLQLSDGEWRDLQQVFARGQDGEHSGLTPGFLEGSKHQRLVRGRNPRHRGSFVGTVQRVTREGIVVALQQPIQRGFGVVFDQGDPQREEQGGQVFNVRDAGSGAELESGSAGTAVFLGFGRGQIDLRQVQPGQLIWQTKNPVLEGRLKSSYDGLSAAAQRRLPVAVSVTATLGAPLRVVLTDSQGCSGSGETGVAVALASGRPLTAGELQKGVGQNLGGEAPLAAASWDFSGCDFSAGLFVPAAAVKEARRQAVGALLTARQRPAEAAAHELRHDDVLGGIVAGIRAAGGANLAAEAAWGQEQDGAASADSSSSSGSSGAVPALRVLCRSRAQVDAALTLPWLREVVLDFLEVHGLKEACASVRESGRRVVVATPRILKPDEERLWLFYLRLGADALLLRSAGLLHHLMELGGPGADVEGSEWPVPELHGDFSLNAANGVTADLLLRSGLSRLAPTHDCNSAQLTRMAHLLGSRACQLEIILHQHLPIFHTEHCVFCRFLSDGNDYRDCGHPCETSTLHLRDDKGKDHLVLADMGCRNTVFNAAAQSGLPHLPEFVSAGIRCFRVELVDESPDHVPELLERYNNALHAATTGSSTGRQAMQETWRWIQELPDANGRPHGVSLGSLESRGERAAGSMKPTAASLR